MKLQSYSTFYCQQPCVKKVCPKPDYSKLGEEFTTGTFYKCAVYDYVFVPLES